MWQGNLDTCTGCHGGKVREALGLLDPPLWSDGGMGLFGIYAHGISESWVMEKALIGLVACETERHTAENITKWTKDALLGIGLKAGDLLKPADGGA